MDKRFFEQAADEVSSGKIDKALMAKAKATALGDAAKTDAIYLSLRASEIRANERRQRLKVLFEGDSSPPPPAKPPSTLFPPDLSPPPSKLQSALVVVAVFALFVLVVLPLIVGLLR